MRSLIVAVLALSVAVTANAQSEPPPDEDQPPVGPLLQTSDTAPVVCDPNRAGFRYLQVTGTGFDAWATQRLVGDVVDASGAAQIHWSSIWVSPQGRLTLEVNLCNDPFQKRPALAAGDYTVSVGQSNGATIAETGISLMPPPEQADEAGPAPTPTTTIRVLPTPTPVPRVGIGTLQQPTPLGVPGNLVDGWQLVVSGIKPDAYSAILAAIPSAAEPAVDQRDFMLRAQATYRGPGTGVFSSSRLALMSGLQIKYDQIHNSCGVIPDFLAPLVVTSGTTLQGNVCFTVRLADIDSLVLVDNQSLDADNVYFALK